MIISPQFNAFYHAVLNDFHVQASKPDEVNITFDKFKEVMKFGDPLFPVDARGALISIKVISNKDLVAHVEHLVKYAGSLGITLSFAQEEWDRVMEQARNYEGSN